MSAVTGSKALITAAVMISALMAFVDISVVNVALSDIRGSLGTPINEVSWVSTSYMMANVISIPLSGWLQGRLGYRAYFTAAIVVFTVGSALCGVAWNLPSLVTFRALQGLGGGAIIPTSQAILFLRYPREEHAKAAALIGLGAIAGPLLGPYLGGKLVEIASWHFIFLVNVPLGIVAAVLSWLKIGEPGFRARPGDIDRVGTCLLVIGLLSLQYVLEEGYRDAWFASPRIVVLSVVAAVALIAFVIHALETPQPIVSLSLFFSRSYAAASAINFLIGISVFSGGFMTSLFCGAILDYTALDIGRLLLVGNVLLVVLMPLMGRLSRAGGGRAFIGAGVIATAYSLWINGHLTPVAGPRDLIGPLLFRAVGIATIFVPLMPYALSDVPTEQRGNASALFNLTRELGGSIGIAWMTSMLGLRATTYAASLKAHLSAYDSWTADSVATMTSYLHTWSGRPEEAVLHVLNHRIGIQAMSMAFNDDFMELAACFLASITLVPLLRSPSDAVADAGTH